MQSDTRKLLITGLSVFLTGSVAAALMLTVLGGVSRQGPHSNAGWLALMVAMGCVPTGGLMLLLAVAKLFGDRQPH